MKHIFEIIVKMRRLVILLFILLAIISAYYGNKVVVNSDLSDYLPKDSDSTAALSVMEEEFDGEIPNLRFMVKNISLYDAQELKDEISSVDGVKAVTWASDKNYFDMPLEMLPGHVLEDYYKDGNALYTLTVDEACTVNILDDIRGLTQNETCFAGSFVEAKVAQSTSSAEIIKTVAIAILFSIVVLGLTLDSYIEPFLILFCLGVAVVLNNGSNYLLGSVSSVTNTAASVLQMGVSVDYFIFLLHRYKEYRAKEMDYEQAMVKAMQTSVMSITSSSVTTIIGFAALAFMKYLIGRDMGIVLSKGVAISLFCAFTLLPCVILAFDKVIEKTKHKLFFHSVGKIPEISVRICIPAMIVFVVIAGISVKLQSENMYYYGSSHSYKDTHYVMKEKKEIEKVFGQANTMVLLVPDGDTKKEYKLTKEIEDIEEVTAVTSLASVIGPAIPADMIPGSIKNQLDSGTYSRFVIVLDLQTESEETFAMIEYIKGIASGYYGSDVHMAGESVSTYDLKKVIHSDNVKVNLIAAGAIFVVLLLSFRSFILPLVLTLTIEGAIWIDMAVPALTHSYLFYIGYLIVSSILLGATVDYAILLTGRYRENMQNVPFREAMAEAINKSSISIFTSGSVLSVAGFMLNVFCTNQIIAQLGILLARGTVIAMLVILVVLPGFLKIIDNMKRSIH